MYKSMISEYAFISLVMEILADKIYLPVGEIGKIFSDVTLIPNLSLLLKDKYGGLKKFLEQYPYLIILASDHLFNPNAVLRCMLTPVQVENIERKAVSVPALMKSRKYATKQMKSNFRRIDTTSSTDPMYFTKQNGNNQNSSGSMHSGSAHGSRNNSLHGSRNNSLHGSRNNSLHGSKNNSLHGNIHENSDFNDSMDGTFHANNSFHDYGNQKDKPSEYFEDNSNYQPYKQQMPYGKLQNVNSGSQLDPLSEMIADSLFEQRNSPSSIYPALISDTTVGENRQVATNMSGLDKQDLIYRKW